MIISHYKYDEIKKVYPGNCFYMSDRYIPIKIGSTECTFCPYNKVTSVIKREVVCNVIESKTVSNYYWYDNDWIIEERYNKRFVSDDTYIRI